MNLLNLFDILDTVGAEKRAETPAGIPPAVQVSQADGQPATIVVPVATTDEVEVLEDEHEDSLDLGDEVIITGNVQFQGKTGRIVDFGVNKHFVVVDLYNFGKHSFHSSNVAPNDYADSEEEDADWRERDYGLFGDDERDEVDEGAEFGAYYYEQLAQKMFDLNPNFSTKGRADELLNAAFPIAVQDLGKKRAQWEFGYDEDFVGDFVSAYGYLQRGEVDEGRTEQIPTGRRHYATYGDETPKKDPLDHLDKVRTNRIEKALGVKFDREKTYQGGVKVDEETTDVYRKVFKKNGKPVGEVGIDLEASPGNGDWYVKHYASGADYSGYQTKQDAIDELKYMVSQGLDEQSMAEGVFDIFKKLPASGSTVKVAGRPVKITRIGAGGNYTGSDYIGYSWVDKNGKDHYEETPADEHSNLRSLAKTIAAEIKYADEQGVAEGLGKNIKRGLQGWRKGDNPKEIRRLAKDADDADIKGASRIHTYIDNTFGSSSEHSPVGFNRKVIDREMKKRGLGEQGVAEGEYDDPRWEPREPDMSRKVDWDIEAERNAPDESEPEMTVTVRDANGKVVLTFPSTGGYYGDVRYALSKGFDTEAGDYDIKWKRDTNEGNNWLDTPVSEDFDRIKKLAGLK